MHDLKVPLPITLGHSVVLQRRDYRAQRTPCSAWRGREGEPGWAQGLERDRPVHAPLHLRALFAELPQDALGTGVRLGAEDEAAAWRSG